MVSSHKFIVAIFFFIFLISLTTTIQKTTVAESTHRFFISVSINSPMNATYYTNSIPLNISIYQVFRSESNISRQANYSLDGQENVPISLSYQGEVTAGEHLPLFKTMGVPELLTLSDGSHKITVSAQFTDEYWSSFNESTVYFNVNTQLTPSPSPSPSPTPTIPEYSVIILLPLLLSVFSVAVIFTSKNHSVKLDF